MLPAVACGVVVEIVVKLQGRPPGVQGGMRLEVIQGPQRLVPEGGYQQGPGQ